MELLSPAGTLESFYAAISNGADAIYLGLDKFSARAYATNFTIENLKPLVDFIKNTFTPIFDGIAKMIEKIKTAIEKLVEKWNNSKFNKNIISSTNC